MIQYDSRKVKPGDTFVAIPGLKHDGAEFIPQALANGATTIVAENRVAVPAGVKFELVPSARQALAYLAAKYYDFPSRKLKLIGVTGTKGKTTVCFLVQSILKKAGFKAGLIGTVTHGMTTPESADLQAELARLVKEGYTHCVLEVSSHALAQERVYECRFAVAIFTNLAHDHLDYHRTMAEYLETKKKLFALLDNEATAIINIDDPAGAAVMGVVKGEVVPFGIDQARHELRSTKHNEFDTEVAAVQIREREMTVKLNTTEIRTPLLGLHNVYNIAAAWQCGITLGIRPAILKQGIEAVKVIPGRQEEVDLGQPFRVIIDFAHTPDSLQKLLETYRPLTKGKLILLFGCPGDRDRAKRPLMGEIAARLADQVIVTTDDPHGEAPEAIIEEIMKGIPSRYSLLVTRYLDRKEAIAQALHTAQKGDIVLIAGRGHEKYQDFNGQKVPLDDKEVVRNLLVGQR
ncbi:MAG: UDP-N-acetylmuramoyl-L-alanyl-D-glutamate--2,6-diaminopimelate ligase [Candidatus Margulisbacteria bacterium]|jgi:UDP-N-acetylmuramoyl-L-alanyl-D-glutamate--2,6-diaminopimelate ligase|nr:UDP-N-acetylmuramoyl-L-alanyl-D-glutamate--2,6-diaminopimelate ligase [Candidatus Margulisiibacteriota bacterium]